MIRSLALPLFALPLLTSAQGAGDELFTGDQVIGIALTFQQPNYMDSLNAYYDAGGEQWMLASVTLTDNTGTYTYDSVGVRLKGNSSGSLPVKKSMKIDFNKYVSGQKYHGLKKINLNNGSMTPPCCVRSCSSTSAMNKACSRHGPFSAT